MNDWRIRDIHFAYWLVKVNGLFLVFDSNFYDTIIWGWIYRNNFKAHAYKASLCSSVQETMFNLGWLDTR